MVQEKSDIDEIPWLIKVWVSERFVKPIRGKSLEEAANEYITDLIDRNLIFVRERGVLGELKSCGIHDLLRDLCLREAQKINLCGPAVPSEIKFMHGIGYRQASLTRCTISGSDSTLLLRMLDIMSDTTDWTYAPNEILQLMNLRFISFQSDFGRDLISRFVSLISLFWNIQSLQIRNFSSEPLSLPPEIWILPHLRHLQCGRCVLPDPPIDKHDSHILENLQTLFLVVFFRCTEEVCTRLPNLKELRVTYDPLSPGVEWTLFDLHNLVHLQKLESLYFDANSRISWKYLSFPFSLKQLTLRGCRLPWKDMTIVGSLPNLEALHLWEDACKGQTWCPIEGQFVNLKLLEIWQIDLLYWRADKTHFPVLEHLILRKLMLEEFPEDFGEHPTLGKLKCFIVVIQPRLGQSKFVKNKRALEMRAFE